MIASLPIAFLGALLLLINDLVLARR